MSLRILGEEEVLLALRVIFVDEELVGSGELLPQFGVRLLHTIYIF